jgi:hypothetical protein
MASIPDSGTAASPRPRQPWPRSAARPARAPWTPQTPSPRSRRHEKLADGLEHGELAFIDAARADGATWSQIAAAMGARNRQTAQKRHSDLQRRCPRPPAVDIPSPSVPLWQETGHDDEPAAVGDPPARARTRTSAPDSGDCRQTAPAAPAAAAADTSAPPARNASSQRKQSLPVITNEIIREGIYELVRAPEHRETRTWHVLVTGTRVGLVRPTWRGERGRPGWEAADNTGLALPPAGIGRITSGGNARTRDAAAVSLLNALQRQQADERKHKDADRTSTSRGHGHTLRTRQG